MDDIRKRSSLFFKTNSRNSLISSSTSSKLYYEHIGFNNDLPDVEIWEPIHSSQISYKNNTVDKKLVSKIADSNSL